MTAAPVKLSAAPEGYADWLAELKSRIHGAQQRAALAVNRELVLLYWQIGCDMLARQAAQGWGAKVIERLARGGASSGDFSNQAIASIALGSNPTIQPAPPREEKPESTAGLGEEAQALINALINQLGGGAP